jgi:hypothetical protein
MKYIILIILFILNYCGPVALIPAWDAQSQINSAVEFRATRCQDECRKTNGDNSPLCQNRVLPQPPLLLFDDVQERNLNLCSIAIIRTSCPLNAYPLICLLVYKPEQAGEIPWWMNFNESSKTKLR